MISLSALCTRMQQQGYKCASLCRSNEVKMVLRKPIPAMPDARKPDNAVFFSYFHNTEWYTDSDTDSDDNEERDPGPIPEWAHTLRHEEAFSSRGGKHQAIGFAKLKPTARILDQRRDAPIIYSFLRDHAMCKFDWNAMVRAGYQGIRITDTSTDTFFNSWDVRTLAVWDTDALCNRVHYKPFLMCSWYYVDAPVHEPAVVADASDDDISTPSFINAYT